MVPWTRRRFDGSGGDGGREGRGEHADQSECVAVTRRMVFMAVFLSGCGASVDTGLDVIQWSAGPSEMS